MRQSWRPMPTEDISKACKVFFLVLRRRHSQPADESLMKMGVIVEGQSGGGFRKAVTVHGHLIDAPHHPGGLGLHHPKTGIVRVLDVTLGRLG